MRTHLLVAVVVALGFTSASSVVEDLTDRSFSSARRVMWDNTYDDGFPALSPDGRGKIVFDSNRARAFWEPINTSVATFNESLDSAADASASAYNAGKLLFRSVNIGASRFTSEIWTMNAGGSNVRRVTCDDRDEQAATWSPDGQTILFNSAEILPDGLPIQNLYFIGAHDECGPGTLLTEGRFADWSPVGHKIAFDRGRLQVRDIYVRYRDGTEVNVTNNPHARNFRASWSPDGNTIAFARGAENAEDIYVIHDDGSGLTQLTFDASGNNGPRFSPNGRRIAFQSNRDGDDEIYVMNVDGTDQTRLTNHAGIDAFPNWSPNGQKIVFHRTAPGGSLQLFIMDVDGSHQMQITAGSTSNAFPAWGAGRDVQQK